MRKNHLLLCCVASCLAASCTKEVQEPYGPESSPITRSIVDESMYLGTPVYIQSYLGESSQHTTGYLTWPTQHRNEGLLYSPTVTMEPADSATLANPYTLGLKTMWYIHKAGNDKYYLVSAVSDLETERNVTAAFNNGNPMLYWNYWVPSYNIIPMGTTEPIDAELITIQPEINGQGERLWELEPVPDTEDIYYIKAAAPQYDNYYLHYDNPDTQGGHVMLYEGKLQNFNKFKIAIAEELEFVSMDYDLNTAIYQFSPQTCEYFTYQNHNTNPMNWTMTWSYTETKSSSWETEHSLSQSLGASIQVALPKLLANGSSFSFSYDQTSTDRESYGENTSSSQTSTSSVDTTIDAGHTVIGIAETVHYIMDVPYTLTVRGLTTNRIYTIKGIWTGVNLCRSTFTITDITDPQEPQLLKNGTFFDETPAPSDVDERHDEEVFLRLKYAGNGYYKLYYSFFNPDYPDPDMKLSIQALQGDRMLLLEIATPKPTIDLEGNEPPYFLFQMPDVPTADRYRLVVSTITDEPDTEVTGSVEISVADIQRN